MLVCISNKADEHKNKDLGVVQNNYICDTKTGVIREAKFSLGEYQELVIDQTYLGPTCMFRTFDFKDGKPLKTPIYYINNETEEIVATGEWECSYLHKDEPTGVDSGMLVHNTYENGDCDWFTCETVKVMNPKEISLHFLLSMNKNFDDDLLQDVVEMIDYSAWRKEFIAENIQDCAIFIVWSLHDLINLSNSSSFVFNMIGVIELLSKPHYLVKN